MLRSCTKVSRNSIENNNDLYQFPVHIFLFFFFSVGYVGTKIVKYTIW